MELEQTCGKCRLCVSLALTRPLLDSYSHDPLNVNLVIRLLPQFTRKICNGASNLQIWYSL